MTSDRIAFLNNYHIITLFFQVTSKVMESQYLHTSCLQAYPIFELNPLLEKLIFNVWECFHVPGTLALSRRSLPGTNVPNLELNTAQSVHKLNSFGEKFFFFVFWWSSHFTKYTRNFLVVKLMVLVDGWKFSTFKCLLLVKTCRIQNQLRTDTGTTVFLFLYGEGT